MLIVHAHPDNQLPVDLMALLADAHALRRAEEAGAMQALLRGRRFGLLDATDGADNEDIVLFNRATTELGGQVAQISPHLTRLGELREIEVAARLLGRLYDAVVCHGVSADLVRVLGAEAAIPVYDGIASADHPLARVADRLDPAIPARDRRRFLLQALLISNLR